MNVVRPKLGHGRGEFVSPAQCYDPQQPYSSYRGRHLPHFEQDGKIQFVTFRLNDSLPATYLETLRVERELLRSLPPEELMRGADQYIAKIDYWLAQGHGECLLKYDRIQQLVDECLHTYDGDLYLLYDYVIMPNHVHLLILPNESMKKIIGFIKRFTARDINRLLGRQGKVWMDEHFDRMIRSVPDFHIIEAYIQQNPAKWYAQG